MKFRLLILLTILLSVLSACNAPASPSPTPAPASEPTSLPDTPTPVPDYVTQVRNAEYQLGLTDSPQTVQLVDGKFERGDSTGTDYVSVTMTDLIAHGDLNKDGVDDVAAMVAENYSGSGVFVFLAVFEDVGGTYKFLSSVLVDDRPQLDKLSVENGEAFLSATIHASDDPMCCPTLQTTRHYQLTPDDQLDLTDYATFTSDGRMRTVAIESPTNYSAVLNTVQVKGNVDIAPFENNLTYRILDVGGVELAKGAITVSAPDPGAPGTFDAVISLGNVLSGAVVHLEVQDINVEDGSLFAMDSVELVVK